MHGKVIRFDWMDSEPAMLTPFHLAIPVRDLEQARAFYGNLLGCSEGRSAARWVDFDFFGHQLVCHLADDGDARRGIEAGNPVDGDQVPVPHFGVVLEWRAWEALVSRLRTARVDFHIEPKIRFAGKAGEQAIFFICDPSGNTLEFKTFKDIEGQLFAR